MKVLVGSVVLAAASLTVSAQTAQTAPRAVTAPAVDAKVIAELASTVNQLGGVKNAPFSAEEVSESVQVLADGNRIAHSSTGKVYRNSEGQMRRDMQGGVIGGVLGSTFTVAGGATIVDPGQRQILLDKELQVARIAELTPTAASPITIVQGARAATEEERARAMLAMKDSAQTLSSTRVDVEKAKEELAALAARAPVAVVTGQGAGFGGSYSLLTTSKYETRSEELGTRDFGGVAAEGRRTTTIIPAGAVGNERPIEVVYERWYSKDLGMVVYSKRSDPRTGEQTYELRNIVRSEPDPSLFKVPSTYTRVSTTGTVYRTAQPMAAAGAVKKRPQQN